MKKQKNLFIFMVFIIIFLYSKVVLAQDIPVKMIAENQGKEGYVKIKLEYNEDIGVIKGKLSYDSNFESIEVIPSYNGWTTTYNADTGVFNSLNAMGMHLGEVIEIKYKLKQNANYGVITLSEIALTTIEYNTLQVEGSINQEIKVQNESKPTEEDQKDNDLGDEGKSTEEDKKDNNFPNEGESTGKDNTDKDLEFKTNQNDNEKLQDQTKEQSDKVEKNNVLDDKKANKILPNTGKISIVYIFLGVGLILGAGVIIKKCLK